MRPWRRPDWHRYAGAAVALSIVVGTVMIQVLASSPKTFLNLYYLPVVFGAYVLGLRRGVYAAVLSCALVFTMALLDQGRFSFGAKDALMYWLELATWAAFLILTAFVVGSMYERQQRQVRDLKQAYRGTIEIMGQFIDSVDRHTENHSHRVADYCVEVARELGLSEVEVEDVRVGAFLHDIGKVEISTDVLRKAAELTDDEMREMRRHVDTGEAMVQKLGGILKHVIPMVAFHHERWDGTGYKCLKGDEIPIGARIIAVCDTYDAIVTDRPYRQGRSHEAALRVIIDERGQQFDPRVVDAFVRLFGQVVHAPAPERLDRAA